MSPVPVEVMWLASAVLVEAAVIDGRGLRVPNWLTFHFAAGGLAFAAWSGGWAGLGTASAGLALGLVLLLPLYAIGGMGAGDVKLMAGLGAWVGPSLVLGAFVCTALVGAAMAVVMIARSGEYVKHLVMFRQIGHEILTVRARRRSRPSRRGGSRR